MDSILLLGASGRLGRSISNALAESSIFCHRPSRPDLDLSDGPAISKFLKIHKPFLVIHAASNLTPSKCDELVMEREAKLTQLIDSNVIEACKRLSIKIIYFSTSLIYGHPKSEKYSEIDLWTSQINKTNRGHYASAKQISTLKIAELNQMGFPFSSVVLPNLLAGPLPGLERIDHLCEKLYQLVKESQKENRKTIDFDVSHNPRLQMLSSLEIAEWVRQNIETKLPGVVNLTNLNCIKPSELLESIIENLELDIKVNRVGIESNGASILLTDTLARTNFAWTGGLSSRFSLECWISELKNEELL